MVVSSQQLVHHFTSELVHSGAIVETVTDSGATDPVVIKLYTNNTVVATVSKDAPPFPRVRFSFCNN